MPWTRPIAPAPTVWQRMRGYAASALIFLAVGTVAYVAWQNDLVPGKIKSHGSLRIETAQGPVDVPTRVINVPQSRWNMTGLGLTQDEIQLPDGRWVACREDCRATYLSHLSGRD